MESDIQREYERLVVQLFEKAADLDIAAQSAFLDQACAGDPALRSKVGALLRADRQPHKGIFRQPSAESGPGGAQPLLETGARIGNYRIHSKLGQGGMGEVYLACHISLTKRAVVKVLRPRFACDERAVQRFLNEAEAAAKIHHPGIVSVMDIGRYHDGAPYILMEYLDGETLKTRLTRIGALSQDVALSLARQVLRALAAAHQMGVIHRDLKPDNLFLVADAEVQGGERVKLLDFGIAKLVQESAEMTRSGELMGTPPYMSPEQIRHTATVDHRSDLYSLGIIFYEMICGRRPFVGESFEDFMVAHLFEPPPRVSRWNPAVSPALEAVVTRLLAKRRDDRYASAHEVIEALDEVVDCAAGGALPRRRPGPTRPRALSPQPVGQDAACEHESTIAPGTEPASAACQDACRSKESRPTGKPAVPSSAKDPTAATMRLRRRAEPGHRAPTEPQTSMAPSAASIAPASPSIAPATASIAPATASIAPASASTAPTATSDEAEQMSSTLTLSATEAAPTASPNTGKAQAPAFKHRLWRHLGALGTACAIGITGLSLWRIGITKPPLPHKTSICKGTERIPPEVAARAKRELGERFSGGNSQSQLAVLEAIRLVGTRQAADLVYQALSGPPQVRLSAAQVIRELGWRDAAPALRDAMEEARGMLRVQLAAVLVHLGDREALAILEDLLRSKDEGGRHEPGLSLAVALALAEFGRADTARPVLAQVFVETPAGVPRWQEAAYGLALLGDPDARRALEDELALGSRAPERAVRAARYLAQLKHPDGTAYLDRWLDAGEFHGWHGDMALALATVGHPGGLRFVAGALGSADARERQLAVAVAGRLAAQGGTWCAGDVAALAAEETDMHVRTTALVALLAF